MASFSAPTLDIFMVGNERTVAEKQRFASTPTILWGFFCCLTSNLVDRSGNYRRGPNTRLKRSSEKKVSGALPGW
jgi:hypothetical protein